MNGDQWYLRNNEQKAALASFVATLDITPDKPYVAKIIPWEKKRSLDQNALLHKWCGEISTQGGEHTPAEVKRLAKYHYGVPILIEDPAFSKFWQTVSAANSYEELIEGGVMDFVPVTRLMDTTQMSRMLDDFQRTQSLKYKLTDPALYGLGDKQ